MDNKGFVNIALIILVVVLAGTTGYFALTSKEKAPLVNEQNLSDNSPNTNEILPTNNQVVETQPVVATNNQEQKNLKSCFNEGALAANVNKSNWKTFEGFGFAVKYPAESISITSVGNPYSGGEFSFEILSLTSPHKANIKVYKLRKEIYRARYLHTASILYEPHSNTWWRDEYIWDPSKFEQCNPNSRGKTDDGKYLIYSTSDGDVGAFFINYFVVLRDIVKTDNYEPLVVAFGTSGDGNDPNYSTYQAFQNILENIIKTLELRPTSKG